MTCVLKASAFLLAALPLMAGATPYDGTYRQAANAECGLVGVDGASIKIDDGIFYGVGMQCLMARPVNVVDMDATLYTMECSGGGDVRSERAMVMDGPGDQSIFVIWNGYVFRYSRCPDPVE
jgi:hypothetical protein